MERPTNDLLDNGRRRSDREADGRDKQRDVESRRRSDGHEGSARVAHPCVVGGLGDGRMMRAIHVVEIRIFIIAEVGWGGAALVETRDAALARHTVEEDVVGVDGEAIVRVEGWSAGVRLIPGHRRKMRRWRAWR